jgi:flagellar biosynthesis anti-sigma factor FlgM
VAGAVMKLSTMYMQVKAEKIQTKKTKDAAGKTEIFPPARETDQVQLSAGSREVQKMHDILQQTPEIRAEKVLVLKERIERAEYSIDPQGVADKMLQDFFSHDFI